MNALKQNPFLTALGAITIIACGVLIFLIVQAGSRLTETKDAYDAQESEYERLIRLGTFPSEENLQRLSEYQEQYAQDVAALRAELEQRQMEISELSTTGFQDVLIRKVDTASAKAQEKGVELPEDFFLGFNRYRANLPLPEAVPLLTLEMEVIDDVVERILESPAAAIENIERAPLPIEEGITGDEPEEDRRGGRRNPQAAAPTEDELQVLDRHTFLVQFRATQGNLQEILNSLLQLEQLATMQLVHIRNEKSRGPSKAGEDAPIDPETGQPIEQDPDAAQFILGSELVEATIRFQIIEPAEDAQEQLEELL